MTFNPLLRQHRVECAWRLRGSGPVVIGPEPRTVLQVQARRDAELRVVHLDFLGLGPGNRAEFVLAQQPRPAGLRVLRCEGEPWVCGREDFPAGGPDVLPLTADTYHALAHPSDFYTFGGRVTVPRGACLSIVLRALRPAACRAWCAGF